MFCFKDRFHHLLIAMHCEIFEKLHWFQPRFSNQYKNSQTWVQRPQNGGGCRQVVVIWKWSLTQAWLYFQKALQRGKSSHKQDVTTRLPIPRHKLPFFSRQKVAAFFCLFYSCNGLYTLAGNAKEFASYCEPFNLASYVGFRLKAIFANNPAAPKNLLISKVVKINL